MSGVASSESLPRPEGPPADGESFDFSLRSSVGSTRLSASFLLLQAYLFMSQSAVDEHFAVFGALRPRLLLGLLVLTVAVVQGLHGKIKAGEGLTLRHVQSRWLAAFIIAGVFSTVWAYDSGVAREPLVAHVLAALSYMLILSLVHTRREFLITILTICAGAGLFILLSLWEWFHGRHDFTMGVLRMQGAGSMYRDPNSFGATIMFVLPIFVWVGIYSTSWVLRVASMGYGVMAAYCTFKTSSRSALVLLVLTGLWTLTVLKRSSHRVVAVVVLSGACVVLLSTLSPSQVARIKSLASSETYAREESTVGRIEGYAVGFEMLRRRPGLGVGPGNWAVYRQRKMDGKVLHAHNLAGSLVAERGGVGTFTFLVFLWVSVLFGWRAMLRLRHSPDAWERAVARFCFAMLCVYALLLVSGLGAHNLDRPNWYWASALMIVSVYCRSPAQTESSRRGR